MTDLYCVLEPYYMCESCFDVQCKACVERPGSKFDLGHPRVGPGYYRCKQTGMRVNMPRIKQK